MAEIRTLRIALLLAAIFAAGLITGRMTAPEPPVLVTTKAGRLQTAAGALAKFTRLLDLDSDQQRRLRPVMEEAAERMVAHPPVSRERLAVYQDTMRRVREQLRPEQLPAFDRHVQRSVRRFERLIRGRL